MNSVKDILQSLGYTLRDDGKFFRAKPPYRESGNPTSLRIDKVTGRFIDFSANLSGSLNDLIKLTTGEKKSLNDYKFEILEERKDDLKVVKDFKREWDSYTLTKSFKFYLDRGIPLEVLEKFEARLCQSGKMTRRIIFPIKDQLGKMVGISGRHVLDDNAIKWKHLGSKFDWVYPVFSLGEIRLKKEVILVESIGDVLALYSAGIKNVLCLFGVILSPKLAAKLMELNLSKIIIATNNDIDNGEVGNKAAETIKTKLEKIYDSSVINISLPPKNDFGKMNKEEILKWYGNRL